MMEIKRFTKRDRDGDAYISLTEADIRLVGNNLYCPAFDRLARLEDELGIKAIDSQNEEIIEAQDKAFEKFTKTDMYKYILGISLDKTNEDLVANNNLNK